MPAGTLQYCVMDHLNVYVWDLLGIFLLIGPRWIYVRVFRIYELSIKDEEIECAA